MPATREPEREKTLEKILIILLMLAFSILIALVIVLFCFRQEKNERIMKDETKKPKKAEKNEEGIADYLVTDIIADKTIDCIKYQTPWTNFLYINSMFIRINMNDKLYVLRYKTEVLENLLRGRGVENLVVEKVNENLVLEELKRHVSKKIIHVYAMTSSNGPKINNKILNEIMDLFKKRLGLDMHKIDRYWACLKYFYQTLMFLDYNTGLDLCLEEVDSSETFAVLKDRIEPLLDYLADVSEKKFVRINEENEIVLLDSKRDSGSKDMRQHFKFLKMNMEILCRRIRKLEEMISVEEEIEELEKTMRRCKQRGSGPRRRSSSEEFSTSEELSSSEELSGSQGRRERSSQRSEDNRMTVENGSKMILNVRKTQNQ